MEQRDRSRRRDLEAGSNGVFLWWQWSLLSSIATWDSFCRAFLIRHSVRLFRETWLFPALGTQRLKCSAEGLSRNTADNHDLWLVRNKANHSKFWLVKIVWRRLASRGLQRSPIQVRPQLMLLLLAVYDFYTVQYTDNCNVLWTWGTERKNHSYLYY
jgi:hypothetical protein